MIFTSFPGSLCCLGRSAKCASCACIYGSFNHRISVFRLTPAARANSALDMDFIIYNFLSFTCQHRANYLPFTCRLREITFFFGLYSDTKTLYVPSGCCRERNTMFPNLPWIAAIPLGNSTLAIIASFFASDTIGQ